MIVPLPYLLARAQTGGYALGYFEAWDSYSLEAVIEAAEAEDAPVILGFGCMMVSQVWLDTGGIETLGCLGHTLAQRTHVPVAFLLNEAHTYQECLAGMQAGFNAVMLDTSTWPLEDAVTAAHEQRPSPGHLPNEAAIEEISKLVEVAHARGVAVEAELGHLPDATEQGIDASLLTDPEEAARFVEQTGIDCLAVSIGNVHLLTQGVAPIDLSRLAAIHERVALPLVIHGGTGFPPEVVPGAIRYGAAKFNVGTILKKAFWGGIRESVLALDATASVHDVLGSHREGDYLLAGKRAMQAKVQAFLQLYGSCGHAHDIASRATARVAPTIRDSASRLV